MGGGSGDGEDNIGITGGFLGLYNGSFCQLGGGRECGALTRSRVIGGMSRGSGVRRTTCATCVL